MKPLSRRSFALLSGATLAGSATIANAQTGGEKPASPVEAPFERDYDAPEFKPSWKKQQINRTLAQDFVIYAHSDLDKVKMLLDANADS